MTHPILGCRPLHAPVVCSGRLLSFWYRKLNTLLWRGRLDPVQCLARRLPADRLAHYDPDLHEYVPGSPVIVLDPRRHRTRGALFCSLLHEMIHADQHQRGLPLTHGAYFRAEVARIHKITGIKP